jgi:hypothetical protein
MSIILLRGFSHSGKDFIGQILCEKYDYKRFAFADSLKKMVQLEFNCKWEHLHTQEGKLQICESDSFKRTYRQILIDEALRLRNIDSGVFAKHCCSEIIGLNPEEDTPERIVITDWRYPNEIAILESLFSDYKIIPVLIERINQSESPVNDISEHQLDSRQNDYVLHNNMNETIYQEIEELIKKINEHN